MTTLPEGSAMHDGTNANEIIDLIGGRLELVARMGAADGDTVLFRTRIAPGHAVPLHSHIDPECFYVLAGSIEVFLVDDRSRWHPVPAGQSLLVAHGIKHAVRNPSAEAADLVVATNGRLARFFREAGRPVGAEAAFVPPTPEDLTRLISTAESYGYWLATPDQSAAITALGAP